MTRAEFITQAYAAAKESNHPFPDWATCEAALCCQFGTTEIAAKGNNLFDFRVPAKLFKGARTMPVDNGPRMAQRLAFDSWRECFAYRAAWLLKMPMFYLVRKTNTGDEYMREIAKFHPATVHNPDYEASVRAIHEEFKEQWA